MCREKCIRGSWACQMSDGMFGTDSGASHGASSGGVELISTKFPRYQPGRFLAVWLISNCFSPGCKYFFLDIQFPRRRSAFLLLPPPPSSSSYTWTFPLFFGPQFSSSSSFFSFSFFLSLFLSLFHILSAPPSAVLPPTPFFI